MTPRGRSLHLVCFLGGAALVAGCRACVPVRRYEGRHIDVHCDVWTVDARGPLAEGDRHVERVSALLGLTVPPKRVRVYVFPSHLSLSGFLALECPSQWDRGAACFETPEGFVVAIARQWRPEETQRYLRHELTHYVLAWHFHHVPPWLDEGLAQYCERGEPFARVGGGELESAMRRIGASGGDALEALVAAPPGEKLSRRQYALSKALVRVFINDERFGLDRLLCYLHADRSDGGAGEDFHRCFGVAPRDLCRMRPVH
jgi:hypothetical protein